MTGVAVACRTRAEAVVGGLQVEGALISSYKLKDGEGAGQWVEDVWVAAEELKKHSDLMQVGMSNEEQMEFFLRKFNRHPDVKRPAVWKLMKEFEKFDDDKAGELNEHQALRLLEARGETKTAADMREMVKELDSDANGKLSLLEWCCAIFGKSWEELHAEVHVEVRVVKTAAQVPARLLHLPMMGQYIGASSS